MSHVRIDGVLHLQDDLDKIERVTGYWHEAQSLANALKAELAEAKRRIVAEQEMGHAKHDMLTAVIVESGALRAALENVLGFCATRQGMEAEMAVDDARKLLGTERTADQPTAVCPECDGLQWVDFVGGTLCKCATDQTGDSRGT